MTDATELTALLAKATPGPWKYEPGDVLSAVCASGDEYKAITFNTLSNHNANSALIAMAPDLAADVLRLAALVLEARAIITHPEPGSIEAQQMVAQFLEATK